MPRTSDPTGPGEALEQLREALAAERDGGHATPAGTQALIGAAMTLGWAELAYDVGLRYYHGEGVPRDPAAARAWWRRAAEAGLPEAQYNLAVMLTAGLGGPADRNAAGRWLSRAAASGLDAARAVIETPPPGAATSPQPPDVAAPGGRAEPAPAVPDEPAQNGSGRHRPAGATGGLVSDGAAWLRTRPPRAWTLQLASGESASGLWRLVTDSDLGLPATVVPVRDGRRLLYTALAGEFARRDEALAALASLPERARRFGPRARRMRTLQALLPAPDDGAPSTVADH